MLELSDNLLCRLSDFVSAQLGLHFPKERWPDLERGIRSAAQQLCFDDLPKCVESILASKLTRQQIEILASHLTIGETYFFRDKNVFTALEIEILPELIQKRRGAGQRLRIWSAGCCSGEEAYSIAMIVRKVLPDFANWNVTILATDINPKFLQKARAGVYKEWSFRGTPDWLKRRWFEQRGKNEYVLREEIRDMVTFSYLNLAQDGFPALLNNTNAMDIIFCRNVLMYFSQQQANRVVSNFHHALLDGGWFIVSPSEMFPVMRTDFTPVKVSGATFYRKQTEHPDQPRVEPEEVSLLEISPQYPSPQPVQDLISTQHYRERGIALYEAGHYAPAAEFLRKASELNPQDVEVVVLVARSYANDGQLGQALHWCERAIALRRLNPEMHYLHATILQEKGETELSSASLNRALYLDPEFVLAHFALGNIALRSHKPAIATNHFERALTLLNKLGHETIIPASEGLTAGRLREIIRSLMDQEVIA